MKFILCVLFVGYMNAYGQQSNIKPLDRGEAVPDLAFITQTGKIKSSVHLSDYKGKLIVFDFWSTHCPGCIAGLPHMLELQEEFKDKIKVFIVTEDKGDDILEFWQELPKLFSQNATRSEEGKRIMHAGENLPFIVADTTFDKYFSHPGTPTHVWVDENLRYLGTFYGITTTKENILSFLQGGHPRLDTFRRESLDKDNALSWLGNEPRKEITDQLQSYSFILNRIENGGARNNITGVYDSSGALVGFNCVNQLIPELYKLAYFGYRFVQEDPIYNNYSRIIIETKSKKRFFEPKTDVEYIKWQDTNIVCYALQVPASSANDLYPTMRQELDRYFGLSSSFEKRSLRCYVLKRRLQKTMMSAADIDKTYFDKNQTVYEPLAIQSYPDLFRNLINPLFQLDPSLPYINETDEKAPISMKLPWKIDAQHITLADIQTALRLYGYDLVLENKIIDVVVLKDPSSPRL